MPKVGKQEFPYTKAGYAAAKKAAKKQGVKMVNKKHEKTESKKERMTEYGTTKRRGK
jgi:hypothetical protein